MREPRNHFWSAPSAATTWSRPLALTTAVVFLFSCAFPAVAGLSKDTGSFPSWWGALDVGVAFFLGILVIALFASAQQHVTTQAEAAAYRVYRFLTHAIFATIIVFLMFPDRIIWINCLPGFAWRTWLLLYSLPVWLIALDPSPGGPRQQLSGLDQIS
jgi:hypothetical protein